MDGARLSSVPHHSWFGFSFVIPPTTVEKFESRDTTHSLLLGMTGGADIRSICRGREQAYAHRAGEISFFACDHEWHTRVVRSAPIPSGACVLEIPAGHLKDLLSADEGECPDEWPSFLPRADVELRQCMLALCRYPGDGVSGDIGSEIAARGLVVRLAELLGGKVPEWRADTGTFTPAEAKRIVDYIDAHIHRRISLEEVASVTGLSPSHCARKFRHSEGLSLGRFVNRRRLGAALVALRSDARPLSQLSLDLGFSSQSHFTRLFSDLTGLTPARYRRQFRRVSG